MFFRGQGKSITKLAKEKKPSWKQEYDLDPRCKALHTKPPWSMYLLDESRKFFDIFAVLFDFNET